MKHDHASLETKADSLESKPVIIALQNIHKSYQMGSQEISVLTDINLMIKDNEALAILGASGSGKSTLMNIIGLLDTPTQGLYSLNHQSMADQPDHKLAAIRNKTIGFVFQQFNLLSRLSVLQNVMLPLLYSKTLSEDPIKKAREVLKKVGMNDYAHHRPNQLSGGQQQRIAIARALINTPRILLADEPTGALDRKTGQDIMDLFLGLHQSGLTLILITHDEKIAQQTRRQIILRDGRIHEDKA